MVLRQRDGANLLRYQNPVWPGYLADPFVLRAGEEFFTYGTGGPEDGGKQSDGRMFPLLCSRDLASWEYIGGALEPIRDAPNLSYWAPEVAASDGVYFMYYSAGGSEGQDHRIRVATAKSPKGPFLDKEVVLMPGEPFSIDPHPFQDPMSGKWYLFFAKDFLEGDRPGTGTAVVELGEDMMSVTGPIQTVLRATSDWQIFERGRFWYGRTWPAWHTVEGPFVTLHGGRYYCFYSGGRWESEDYGVGFGSADRVTGPYVDDWRPDGPSVLRGSPGRVFGPGHNSLVLGPNNRVTFVAYHAWNAERSLRRFCLDPLVWTPGGPRCDGPSTDPRFVEDA